MRDKLAIKEIKTTARAEKGVGAEAGAGAGAGAGAHIYHQFSGHISLFALIFFPHSSEDT